MTALQLGFKLAAAAAGWSWLGFQPSTARLFKLFQMFEVQAAA